MNALNTASVHHKGSTPISKYFHHTMDYRQKMVIPPTTKYTHAHEDDEDLEALRLAALKSLRAKPVASSKATVTPVAPLHQNNVHHPGRPSYVQYNQRFGRRDYYHPNRQLRHNGNVYHPSRVNQNLIEIIPVDESQTSVPDEDKVTTDTLSDNNAADNSKFKRFNDHASGSEDEESKDQKPLAENIKCDEKEEPPVKTENQGGEGDSPKIDNENQSQGEEDANEDDDGEDMDEENDKELEDDDDILLMADLEEEDSLERLMDEMEKEMNVGKPSMEKREKKSSKRENKDYKKSRESKSKNQLGTKADNCLSGEPKSTRRSDSPYRNRGSLSPKIKSRKRSPKRSPVRLSKKSQREIPKLKSPRKSPPRYSPRPRSPRSPRRSPNRSPIRRLSPRPHSRSPLRVCRSRSPKLISRSRSPRFGNRTRSPLRSSQTRSPLPRSPRLSPRRSRSPRSLRNSPRRVSPRRNSPRNSPRRSPWSSPRNSPRLSPRRRRSPPRDRKHRSFTPEESVTLHRRVNSPTGRNVSPDISKSKQARTVTKQINELPNDPVLEARRRKFESMEPINPVNANKKIKLSKKEEAKCDSENIQTQSPKDNTNQVVTEYDEIADEELSMHEHFDALDDLEQILSDAPVSPAMSIETAPSIKIEKEKVKKKKKKDKEIYQIGKLKETKKSKKKKEMTPEVVDQQQAKEAIDELLDEETDLRTELSRRRAERLNRAPAIQSARLLQSAFKGVVNEVAKNKAKVNHRHLVNKNDDRGQKDVRRVTVLHRPIQEISDSEENVDSKVPVKFRLGLNKVASELRESKSIRKPSKRQGRK